MPDAHASGRLAMSPIAIVMTAAPMHVAVTAAETGTPPADRMSGFTTMM